MLGFTFGQRTTHSLTQSSQLRSSRIAATPTMAQLGASPARTPFAAKGQRNSLLVVSATSRCTEVAVGRHAAAASRGRALPAAVGLPRQAAAGRHAAGRQAAGPSKGHPAAAPLPPRRTLGIVQAAPGGGGGQGPGPNNAWGDKQQRRLDQQIVIGAGVALTLLVVVAFRLGGDAFQEADSYLGGGSDFVFGAGDAVGALLWATSLYFCSPVQLLLLFFGFIETERPSDWVLRQLGTAAGLPVGDLEYTVPAGLQVAAVSLFAVSGVALAAGFQALLGDATWSVSTGLGACMAAGMYEVGRPRRLSVEEAQAKESLWQDFRRFADGALQRRGRCHETEILRALGREMPRYRGERQLDSATLRTLVRNWHPDADRTSNGYYKNVSLAPAGGDSSGAAGVPSTAPAAPLGTISSTDSTDQY